MYRNSDSEGTSELLEIPSMHVTINILFYIAMRIYMSLKVYKLPTLKVIFFQEVLNIVVYPLLIVINVLVSSATL